jgi:Ca2+-binding RTX toxin-like protein
MDGLEQLELTGTGNTRGTGNAAANVILGNDGSNLIDGAAGADLLYGGGGDDTYIVDDEGDRTTKWSVGSTAAVSTW